MTIEQCLRSSKTKLSQAGVATARLDSLVLLEHVTKKDRAWLLANQKIKTTPNQQKKLNNLLIKRSNHTPVAQLIERVEFYGRNFFVNDNVLIPRPETETMIDIYKEAFLHVSKRALKDGPVRVLDVGTGSGAVGITCKLETPEALVELSDIDILALKVAKINVDKYTLNLKIIRSDLIGGVAGTYDILLCNLPYVPDNYPINKAASHEPKLAIFGGKDGLDVYRRLFSQITKLTNKPLYILIECFAFQVKEVTPIAKAAGYKSYLNQDFITAFKLET